MCRGLYICFPHIFTNLINIQVDMLPTHFSKNVIIFMNNFLKLSTYYQSEVISSEKVHAV